MASTTFILILIKLALNIINRQVYLLGILPR